MFYWKSANAKTNAVLRVIESPKEEESRFEDNRRCKFKSKETLEE